MNSVTFNINKITPFLKKIDLKLGKWPLNTPLAKGHFSRMIFTAIDNHYDIVRLKERVKTKEAFTEIKCDRTTVLHYLAGADPYSGLSLPLREPPPKKFVKCLIDHAPSHLIYQLNAYGESPLSIAAKTGYETVVRKLLEKKVQNGKNPVHAALLSTVYFDPEFKIPKLLLKAGFPINQKNIEPLSMLVESIDQMVNKAKSSLNSLYNDIERISNVHFKNLPKKIEWVLEQGAKEDQGNFKPIKICLKMMDPYVSSHYRDSMARSIILPLIKHSDSTLHPMEYPVLHKLVDRQCEQAVEAYLQKGAQIDQKDEYGLTAYDLAKLNMNPTLMKLLKPESDPKETLSKLSLSYIGEMLFLLPIIRRPKCEIRDRFFITGLPGLLQKPPVKLEEYEAALFNLYLPLKGRTPMALAFLEKDIHKVEKLVSDGWNIHVESDFIAHFYHKNETEVVSGVEDSLYELHLDQKTRPFWKQAMGIFCANRHTGITLSNEFERALRDISQELVSEEYIFALFDELGLCPAAYSCSYGNFSLSDRVEREYYNSFNDERGFHTYRGYEQMERIFTYAEKKGWLKR